MHNIFVLFICLWFSGNLKIAFASSKWEFCQDGDPEGLCTLKNNITISKDEIPPYINYINIINASILFSPGCLWNICILRLKASKINIQNSTIQGSILEIIGADEIIIINSTISTNSSIKVGLGSSKEWGSFQGNGYAGFGSSCKEDPLPDKGLAYGSPWLLYNESLSASNTSLGDFYILIL
jgi:hypothetical protein